MFEIVTVPVCSRCNTKVLRPERCVALDGKPCTTCAEDTELEQVIQELGSCSDEIHVKRRALRTAMNRNHDPFIHKFPPEISSQMFLQYAMALNVRYGTRYRQTLLFLGAVCQTWRQLAWATPEIWTSVFV
jgi:hypothetical protein